MPFAAFTTAIFSSLSLFAIILQTVNMFEKEGVNFETVFERLLPRPWVIDDLDQFKSAFIKKTWKKVDFLVGKIAYLFKPTHK